jgi:ribosomal protein L40E
MVDTSRRLARSPDVVETWICSQCGARNRSSAEWCGQCYSLAPGVEEARAREATPDSGANPEATPDSGARPEGSPRAASPGPAGGPNAATVPPEAAPASLEEALLLFARNRSIRSRAAEDAPVAGASAPAAAPPGPAGAPPAPAGAPPAPPVQRGAFTVAHERITWSCRRCDAVNDFAARSCSVCGTPFAEVLREPGPARPARDPGTTALLSLLFPGAGHAYLGLWGQAIARAVVSGWVGLVVLFAALQGGAGAMPTTLAFGIAAFSLWAVAAHDAYREARGEGDATVLKSRHFVFLVLGLLGLQIGLMVVTALGAR